MSRESAPALLTLHAVRLLGYADDDAIARRFQLDPAHTEEFLGDAEAWGWIQRTTFADLGGWSLTEAGRAENERQLKSELSDIAGTDRVHEIHREFLPWNTRLQRACTDWQLRPVPDDRLAANDHTDPDWDAAVFDELGAIERALRPIAERLGQILTRFNGYDTRFTGALGTARAGNGDWVDRTDVDSCHRVWFELHEDLVATLGLDRRATHG